MRSLSGRNLGAYRLIEQVGVGGMAVIYKAYDPGLDRYVAIKILPEYLSHDEEFSVRFRNEARNVARLSHPNILPIYGYGEEEGMSYFVMGLVEGGTLKEQMGHPMDPARAASIIRQLANALQYAHQQGIVHRDVKPANVLMSHADWPLLSDFGIARVLEQKAALTRSAFLGTPHYMAPEQARGEAITPKTDQYALGIVLYEMLTGTPPYQADTPQAVVYQHIYSSLPLPHERNSNISDAMERVILKALAKDPADRFPDMSAFAAAVQSAAGEPVGASGSSRSPDVQPPSSQVPAGSPSAPSPGLQPASVTETGPSTERLDHTPVPAVAPIEPPPAAEQPRVDRPAPLPWSRRTLGLVGAAAVALIVVVLGLIRLTGVAGGGPTQLTVIAPPGTTLPGFTVRDTVHDTDVQTVSPRGASAQLPLKEGRYQLQFPTDSQYGMPAPVTLQGGSTTLRLGDIYALLKIKAPSGAPPAVTVRSLEGTDVSDLTSADVQNGIWVLKGKYRFEFASGSGYSGRLPATISGPTTIDLGKSMGFFRVAPFPGTRLPSAEVDDTTGAYEASITPDALGHSQALPPGNHLLSLDSHSGYAGKIPLRIHPGSHLTLKLAHLYGHVSLAVPSGTTLPDFNVTDAQTGASVAYVNAGDAQQGGYLRPGIYKFDLSGSNIFLDPVTVSVRAGASQTVDLGRIFARLSITPFPHAATPGFDVRDPSGSNSLHTVDAAHALQDLYLRPGAYSLAFSGASNTYYEPIPVALRPHTPTNVNLGRQYGGVDVVSAPGAPISSLDVYDARGRRLSSVNGPNPFMYLRPGRYSLALSSESNAYQEPLSVTVPLAKVIRPNLTSTFAILSIPGVPGSQNVTYAWRGKADNSSKSVSAQKKPQLVFVLPGTYRIEITNGSQTRGIDVRTIVGKTVKLPAS